MSSTHQQPPKSTETLGNFDINRVAEHLSVHRSTVERLLHAGEFGKDWWRAGRKIIIPKAPKRMYSRTRNVKEKSAEEL